MTMAEYIICTELSLEELTWNKNCIDRGELIRCKDCKYYQQGRDGWLWCMMNHHYTDEEKYCAWAEREL